MRKPRQPTTCDPSRFIPGIYNYCDQWCERCPFTSRCRSCALIGGAWRETESADLDNERFWHRLSEIFRESLETLKRITEEEGLDPAAFRDIADGGEAVEGIGVADFGIHLAERYARRVERWFEHQRDFLIETAFQALPESPQETEGAPFVQRLEDALDVIRWYQHQIGIKLGRALRSLAEESEEGCPGDEPRDSDGSAKVALIGMDRSLLAWWQVLDHVADRRGPVLEMIAQLERLRRTAEMKFPGARSFVRPGFDRLPPEGGPPPPEPG